MTRQKISLALAEDKENGSIIVHKKTQGQHFNDNDSLITNN